MNNATLIRTNANVALERQVTTVESFEARLERLFPTTRLSADLTIEDNAVHANIHMMALAIRIHILDGASIPDCRLLDAIRTTFTVWAQTTSR